ncbi:MAG: alkane 1-monooxygenase [Kangiellaceae bacterium]|jgi:alkane 1-monooxygenase|nr:alkane 1-monooxygenase [Kangiellaceae bacterium]
MLSHTFTNGDDQYIDKKRYLWLLSVVIPGEIAIGPALYLIWPNSLFLWLTPILFYCIIPIGDIIVGDDKSNPPESIVPQLEHDKYYRVITFALLPILLATFFFVCWFVTSQDLTIIDYVAMVLSGGFLAGYAINLGHEMGHKLTPSEQWGAKIALSLAAYTHFNVEHNLGHHKWVATPEDSASSKYGESIYRFYLREYPSSWSRAWNIERTRLTKQGLPLISFSNQLVQGWLLTLSLYTILTFAFGIAVLPFILLVALWGGFQLTTANYIEHYGLKRKKLDNGRYERCQPHHSWNSNHLLSNWTLFHLQRHSDHHTYPMRRYQSLRHFDDIPQLPTGYYGMFLLAYITPLWFKVMNPRVLEAVDNDWQRVNTIK